MGSSSELLQASQPDDTEVLRVEVVLKSGGDFTNNGEISPKNIRQNITGLKSLGVPMGHSKYEPN